jgi:hypothetical protein
MRNHYWTCSKFADRLRGTPKLKSGTSKEWKEWRETSSKNHPIRFWIAEEGLDRLQNIIFYPIELLRSVRYYINNRWVSNTHALTSSTLKKGKWHEFEDRLLHCSFDELVNFVEIDQAWMLVVFDKEKLNQYSVPWYRKSPLRIRKWRSPAAGLEYLNWAAGLKMDDTWLEKDHPDWGEPTSQATHAQELLSLYKWWTEIYPNRPDPYDASGWTAYCEGRAVADIDELGKEALNRLNELEEQYNKEDEEMLIRLIRIRNGIWT